MAWISHRRPSDRRLEPAPWSLRARVGTGAVVAALVLGIPGYFSPGRTAPSSSTVLAGQAQRAAKLGISATPAPSLAHQLYPGGTGDVALTIRNPNPYPMTITALQLPDNAADANGYATSALSHLKPGCLASTPSRVIWTKATRTTGSSHQLTSPLVVGAGRTVTVTITGAATMTVAAPAACERTYFAMPPLTGITARPSPARPGATPVVIGLDGVAIRPRTGPESVIPL